jgi:hypothetical protein
MSVIVGASGEPMWQPVTEEDAVPILMAIRELRPEPVLMVTEMVSTSQWLEACEQRAVIAEATGFGERAAEWRNLASATKALAQPRRVTRSLAMQMLSEARAKQSGRFILNATPESDEAADDDA